MVLTGYNDLQTKHPLIAAQWHPHKNGNLKPFNVINASDKKIWWLCEKGHEYEASINSRVSNNAGCPFCSNKKVLIGFNDIATTNPELLPEWDYKKNSILPTELTIGSAKKIWWQCSKNHSWQISAYHRIHNSNCPYCGNRKLLIGFNDFKTLHPELAKEWNYIKNLKSPSDYINGASKKVWWQCSKCKYEWQATINNRVAHNKGCPHCKMSKLEKIVSDYVTKEQYVFYEQYKFSTCTNKKELSFDFYLPNESILIECDGIQHFENSTFFGGITEFKKRIKNDNIKNQYCKENLIPLLRVPYIYDPIKDKVIIEKFVLDFIQTKEIPKEIKQFYEQVPFSNYIS